MKRRSFVLLPLMLCLGGLSGLGQTGSNARPSDKPYKTGHLRVSDIHEIHYQLGGNPAGRPVMFLHGGPGGGCTAADFHYQPGEVSRRSPRSARLRPEQAPGGVAREHDRKPC
jgi:hypothetical protein